MQKNYHNSTIVTRFAPSPTGLMHIGNARTALFSYLFAKQVGGKFLLRIEDTDQQRTRPEFIATLINDLRDLGIEWNESEVIYQSQRANIYEQFYHQLQENHLIYRCFCSENRLDIMRKLQLKQSLPPRYDGACLHLTDEEINQKISNSQPYCLRFKVPKDLTIEFDDLIKGKQVFNANDFGDFIIKRQDGSASFMFCSVIDDVLQGITHVLRADDHLSNTPRQLLILRALKLIAPRYGHFCLLVNQGKDGAGKLSKRDGAGSIKNLLAIGYLPLALLNYLARLGHSYINHDNQLLSLPELGEQFNLNHTTSNSAKHDVTHLNFWQKQAMIRLNNVELFNILTNNQDFSAIIKDKKLTSHQVNALLDLIKPNILMPQEAVHWMHILFADSLREMQAQLTVAEQNNLLSLDLEWLTLVNNYLDNLTRQHVENYHLNFDHLCQHLSQAGYKNKFSLINLRLLITGKKAGPELQKICQLIAAHKIKDKITDIINYRHQ